MTQKQETALTQKEETSVVKTQNTGIGRGFENVDTSDITMPRAKLLQSNSPEVSDRDYDFRAGDLVHSLLMEKVPQKFVPLSIFNSNILFTPREDTNKIALKERLGLTDEDVAGAVICRASNGVCGDKYGSCIECGKFKFHGNEKPICTPTINVLVAPITEDGTLDMPIILQFASTSYKHGRKFRDSAFYASIGGDLFDRVYKLDTFEASAGGNRWFEMRTKPAGLLPAELKSEVLALYNGFAGKNIVVEQEESVEPSDSNLGGDIDF